MTDKRFQAWAWEPGDLVEYNQLGTRYRARLVEHSFGDVWAADVVEVFSRREPWNANPGERVAVAKGGAKKIGISAETLRRDVDVTELEQHLDTFYPLEK